MAAAVRWGPQYVRQVRLLYYQRACMNYRAPADQVVYERGPGAAALLATSREYTTLATSTNQPAPVGREPACLSGYQNVAASTTTAPGAVLFMHELHLPSRGRRLVIVRSNFAADTPPMFIPGFDLELTVMDPATWKTPPKDITAGMPIDVTSPILASPPQLRIFAGQVDPADESHFTIRYVLDGKRHIADGHLEEWPATGAAASATVRFTTRLEIEPAQAQ
jgi:hypothetical protein